MKFKHQSLFDELNLDGCPTPNLEEIEREVFRWCHKPINNSLNFLPNVLYARARNKPPRILEKADMCGQCNLSFFDDEMYARNFLNETRAKMEKKHKPLTDFYTHLAKGKIENKDGRATPIKSNHFGFFEYESCDFSKVFVILELVGTD